MGFLSSIASGLGGVIAGPFGAIVGSAADTLFNNHFNKGAASTQNEYSWSMWNATNEYNKPINQMKRFEEAGLNPNLIYGQSNTTSQGSVPSVQPTRSNLSQALMNYYTMKNLDVQNKHLSLQNDAQEMQNKKYRKDLETYFKTNIWPSDGNPLAQFLVNMSGEFFDHFGYSPESLAAGAGAYLGDIFKEWMRANGGKR